MRFKKCDGIKGQNMNDATDILVYLLFMKNNWLLRSLKLGQRDKIGMKNEETR